MKDITLSFQDRRPVRAPGERGEELKASASLLAEVVAGGEQ